MILYTRVRVGRLRVGMSLGLAGVAALTAVAFGLWVQPQIAAAAAANTVNFQARLETASGSIAGDGNYNVRFKLYNVPSGGSALWTETYLVSSSQGIRTANGYLTANLGSLTTFPSSISWGQQLYLTMEIGGTGTTPTWDGEMSPRLSLTSVPSAFALNSYNGANGYSSSLSILQPSGGNQTFQIQDQGAAGTYNVCISGSTSCGFAPTAGGTGYIQNQSAAAQATSNFWISGTGKAATALQAPSFDSLAAGNLNIGTTNATSITLGKTGVNTIVAGNLSIGTTSSYGAITIANGAWLTALDSAGTGYVNMLSVNSSNEIQVGAALNIDGGIVLPTDGGQMTLSDLPISTSALAGTAQSYTLRVGSTNALTVYGEADGAGNAQNVRVAIGSSITPAYTLDVGGDINTTGAYRINGVAVCTSSGCSSASGSGNYIQNTTSQQASSNFYISGTGKATTGIQSAAFDTIAAGTLSVGTTNATAITIGKTGVTTSFPGAITVDTLTASALNIGQTTDRQIVAYAGANNHALEIGRTDGVGSTPYLDLHSGATAVDYDVRIIASGGTGANAGGTLGLTAATTNVSGNLQVGGTTVITSSRVLQNVTTDASILTAGTVAGARLSGSYTGITAVGTLTSLTVSGVITSNVATGTAPFTVASTTKVTNLNADTLDGLDSSAFCQGTCVAGGSAAGDLTGTYPNPTIAKLQGSTLTITTPVSGNILQFNGTAWVNQAVSGDIAISSTGVASIAAGSIVNGDLAAGSFGNITGVGTLGSLGVTNDVSIISGGLVVNGNTVITNGRALQNVTYQGGTIAVGYGGTGQTSFTQYGVLFGNNTGALGVTSAGATGQCLVASTGGAPSWGTCAGAGSGVTLQAAYNNSLGGTTPEIVLDSSRTTLDVQAYSGQAADLFNLRAYSAIGLGVLRFGVAADGSVTAAGGLTIQSGGANITGSLTASSTLQGTQLISTVTTGTAPLTINSTTVVANLNADMLDGYHASEFALNSSLGGSYIQNGTALQTANFNISGSGNVGSLQVNGNAFVSSVLEVDGGVAYFNTGYVSSAASTIGANETSALLIQNGTSATLLNADTVNMRLSVGTLAGSAARLHVEGSVASWTARTAAQANTWNSVVYGGGQYVAVASSGTSRVQTSPDGITWTARTAAEANLWQSVAYGNGLFVAVSTDGTNRVMTSPDGITWTGRTAAEANLWRSVTYGNGMFVAVANSGTNRVMTSPDGITWTARAASATNSWQSVTYGAGQFVAVSSNGTNQVMTSPDGITWTGRTPGAVSAWSSVTYGIGQFVAVADSGTNRIMTSPDGITWTAQSAPQANPWESVTYGNGLYIAVSSSGTSQVMTSPDGTTWTSRVAAQANSWNAVTFGGGQFVAVSSSGTNRVMTSPGYSEVAQRVNGSVEVNGLFGINGATTIKESSAVVFQLQDSSGDILFNADTINKQVGVKGTLVVGDAPITYALYVATTPLISAGYSPVSGTITGGGSSPSFTEVADFNNDGAQDAAVADSGGQITIYLDTGSMLTLGYTLSAPVSSMASTFAVADVDGDGDQDIVVSDYGNNRIAVYKNNGNMTFAAAAFYPVAGGPRSIALADVDGDGDKDVATTTYGSAIQVLKNSGTGTYGAAVSYTGIAQATQVILRDFDGDGDQDLFVASQYYDGSYHTYALLRNYGDGTFAAKSETVVTYLYPTEARATDVDNDGDQDVIVSNSNGNSYPEIFVLKNNGSGVFTATSYGAMANSGQSHMSLSDLDGDGDQDVLTTYRWDGLPSSQIRAYYNNGSGAYSTTTSFVPVTSAWMSTATGLDITGDGKTDFFYLNATTSTYVQLNYTGAPTTILASSGSGSYVKAYDINKDGAQDIITVSGGNITVRLKTGPGTYSSTTVSNSMGVLKAMDFADFDNDGDIDIVSVYNTQLSVVKNNGDGTFTAGVLYTVGGSDARDLSLGDMDGDGDLDIVVAAFGSDVVSVMLNSGTGTFTTLGSYATGDGPLSVALADFDKDGNLDVVATCFNSAGGIASTLRNTGTGALAAKVDLSPGPGSGNSVVATGDYNGDGDKDILLLSVYSNALMVYHNNGTGTFSTSSSYSTMASPLSMDVKDIDGDGDKDVVIGYTSNISIMRNNGSANFGTRSDYLPGGGVTSYPLQPVIVDIDGDGDKDVLTSTVYSGSTGNLVAYMNAAGGPSSVPQSTGTLSVTAQSATSGGIFIQGVAGQTANLFLVQNASGNALMALDAQGNLTVSGSILGGIGSPDYAENITVSDPTIEAADVVTMDPDNTESVIKSSAPYDKAAVGVISTSPGFVTNTSKADAPDETQRPLALSGRVPVKVTDENGVIAEGDYLTTSSTLGYAMKATKEGHVIGRAMATFTGTEAGVTECGAGFACGKVLMFIDNSYYSPVDGNNLQANDMTLFGNLGIGGNAVIGGGLDVAQNLNVGGLATLDSLKVTGNTSVQGDLTVTGTATVATLKVGKHILSNSDAPLVAIGSAAGQDGLVTIDGTDVAGTLNVTVKARPQQGNTPAEVLNAGSLADVTFLSPYEFTPRIVISPTNQVSVDAPVYLVKTATGWQLMISQAAIDGTQYQFDYVIIGSQGQAALSAN